MSERGALSGRCSEFVFIFTVMDFDNQCALAVHPLIRSERAERAPS